MKKMTLLLTLVALCSSMFVSPAEAAVKHHKKKAHHKHHAKHHKQAKHKRG